MTAAPTLSWDDLPADSLPIRPGDLDLEHTLTCGQAFRWSQSQSGDWQGIFGGTAWSIRQRSAGIEFKSWPARPASALADYLRMEFDLPAWDREMAGRDRYLDSARTEFRGLRLLKQDPLEVALTFCISAGNTFAAIVESAELMCREYGSLIAEIDGAPRYDFPTIDTLADADERTLAVDCRLDYRGREPASTRAPPPGTSGGDGRPARGSRLLADESGAYQAAIRRGRPRLIGFACLALASMRLCQSTFTPGTWPAGCSPARSRQRRSRRGPTRESSGFFRQGSAERPAGPRSTCTSDPAGGCFDAAGGRDHRSASSGSVDSLWFVLQKHRPAKQCLAGLSDRLREFRIQLVNCLWHIYSITF